MKKNKTTNMGFDDDMSGHHDTQPMTMPLISALGGADLATAEAAASMGHIDESRRLAAQSVLLIAIVVVIAGGVLLTMRMLKGDVQANADTKTMAKLDDHLLRMKNPNLLTTADPLHPDNQRGMLDTSKIISQLTRNFNEKSVPVSQLQKNPFELSKLAAADVPLDENLSDRRRMELLVKLRQELDRLDLQSIAGSAQRAVAVINGEFYRSGQQIGSFKILSIDGSQVILAPMDLERQPGDEPFILKIQEDVKSARPF